MASQYDNSWRAYYPPDDIAYIEDLEKADDPFKWEFAQKLKRLKVPLPFMLDIKSSPMFELSAISLHRNTIPELCHDNIDLAVSGYVRLIDYDGENVYTLFERNSSDPHFVSLLDGDNVPVILHKSELGSPHLLSKSFVMEISLKDSTRGLRLIKAKREIDFKSNIPYDKDLDIEIAATSGKGGDFKVGCTVFLCAVLANVEFFVLRSECNSDEIESYVNVCGKIIATYRARNGFHERVIFDRAVDLKFEDPIKLPPLAVPAYSTLKIRANLMVNGEKIVCGDDPWECEAEDRTFSPAEKVILGHKYGIVLRGRWERLLENGFPEWNDIEGASSEEDEGLGSSEDIFEDWRDLLDDGKSTLMNPQGKMILRKHKKPRGSYDQKPLPTLRKRDRIISAFCSQEFVELFSISVFRYDTEDDVSLHGTIESYDMHGRCVIFDKDISKPEIVHPLGILCLRNLERCYEGPNFGVELYLKDSEGVEICQGVVSVSDHTVQPDRRMCCVVPGIRGFACVHYTVFSDATQARVSVILKSKKGADAYEVCGSIFARYSSYNYSSHHDLKYYQSILFEKNAEIISKNEDDVGFVKLKDGDEMPLLKRMVAVPLNAYLIVDVDLTVGIRCGSTLEVTKVKGKSKFKAEMNGPNHFLNYCEPKFKSESNSQAIGESDGEYEMQVFVEWV